MCGGGHCGGHGNHGNDGNDQTRNFLNDQRIKMEAQFEAARIQMEELEKQRRMEESDEGLGHSGSSDDEKPSMKAENIPSDENIELDADGKRKEDLYQCRYCDRTFCYLCHLKVHERVHTGEKPYKCTFCDCTFSQLGSLTVHMRIHTGEKPYECRICLKKFRHINSLRRHQRQVHRKTPAEVDAAPRGGDTMTPNPMGVANQMRPMTPQFHPYGNAAIQMQAARQAARAAQPIAPPMKSALEMRSYANVMGINPYAFHVQQMQARQMQAMQAQQQQQQLFMKQAAIAQQAPVAPISPTRPVTNHSISAMINEAPKTNKPKKHSFSISALVGEDSDHESHETDDSCRIEEIVDVVSDQNSDVIEPASSPYSNGGNSDSADSGHNSSITNSIIDDDLRRALTIDPTTLSVDEKQRLRRKLAEIALRNISSDSGVSAESCAAF